MQGNACAVRVAPDESPVLGRERGAGRLTPVLMVFASGLQWMDFVLAQSTKAVSGHLARKNETRGAHHDVFG